MSKSDDPSQIHRAHRSKVTQTGASLIDGGAVAVGLVITLGLYTPALLWTLPAVLTIGTVGTGLLFGGFLTGYLASGRARCPLCHGLLLSVAFLAVVSAVTGAATVADDQAAVESVRLVAGTDPLTVLAWAGAAIVIGIFGSALGRSSASRS